jgi:hypothetical protein
VVCHDGRLREMDIKDDPLGGFRRPECGGIEGVGLTCLSFRCLSSYLLFSASSSDQQLRAKLARGHAPARGSA